MNLAADDALAPASAYGIDYVVLLPMKIVCRVEGFDDKKSAEGAGSLLILGHAVTGT